MAYPEQDWKRRTTYEIEDLAYQAPSFLGFEAHDVMLGEGLGEFSDVSYEPGLSDGGFGQATPVPVAVAPPPSSPGIIDSILSPVASITGLSTSTLMLIGVAVGLYFANKRGLISLGSGAARE